MQSIERVQLNGLPYAYIDAATLLILALSLLPRRPNSVCFCRYWKYSIFCGTYEHSLWETLVTAHGLDICFVVNVRTRAFYGQ
jgi:hypothetical protein